MPASTYDEALEGIINHIKGQCDQFDQQLETFFAHRDSDEVTPEQVALLRRLQSVVEDTLESARGLRTRSVGHASPALMQRLGELIRRLEAVDLNIDRRRTVH